MFGFHQLVYQRSRGGEADSPLLPARSNAEAGQKMGLAGSAITDLHLPGDAMPPSWSQHVFLGAGTKVSVASQITAANISGAAALGILPVTISGATTSISLSSGQTLNAKTHIHDLTGNLAALLTAQPTTVSLAGSGVTSVITY